MDEVVKKLVALGTPALILIAIMAATGLPGAAAVTAALAILGGPGGMFGGVIVLGILGLLADAIAKYGVEEIFKRVVDGLRANGKSCAEIRNQIEGYPITSDLKRRLLDWLGKVCPNEEASGPN